MHSITLHTRRERSMTAYVAGLAVVAAGLLAVGTPTATAATPTTLTYSFIGAAQTWVVPAGVTSATFDLQGAAGRAGPVGPAGQGGRATATLSVTPGATITVLVGGVGLSNAGGFNGGGSANSGGGGASDIRIGGTSLDDRVLVAGGGGGGGGCTPASTGGGGGGATGGDSALPPACTTSWGSTAGSGGTQSTPGTNVYAQNNGTFGTGGSNLVSGGLVSGAGGGGWYGGASGAGGGAGGGGSGHGPSGTVFETGVRAGNGVVTITFQVRDEQTVSFGPTPTGITVGSAAFQANATASSGLTIAYSVGAGTTNAACTVSPSGLVTVTQVGTCQIAADQAGNTDYLPATPVTQTFAVGKSTQTVTFSSNPPANPTIDTTDYAAVAAASSGGPVTYATAPATTNNACTVTSGGVVDFQAVGTCVVEASQAGTTQHNAASATQTIAVGKGSQTIAFTGQTPTNPAFGQSYQATATSTSGLPVAYSAGTGNACAVTSTGLVTFDHAGTCTIRANQPGNADYDPAPQVTRAVIVPKATQTVAFTSNPPAYGDIGATYPVAATGGGSGNPVTFTTASASICTVAGTTVTFTGAGQCVVRANQAGNTDYNAAAQLTQTIKVRKAQDVAITSKPTLMSTLGGTYQVVANATSGLAVTLAIGSATTNGACTITGTTVTLVRNGTCVITANQTGNNDWAPALPATQSFAVTRSY